MWILGFDIKCMLNVSFRTAWKLCCNIFHFQALCSPGTIAGFDEDNDVIVLYPGGNR